MYRPPARLLSRTLRSPRWHRTRLARRGMMMMSPDQRPPKPCLLWLGTSANEQDSPVPSRNDGTSSPTQRPPLLLPFPASAQPNVYTADDFYQTVQAHYESEAHFVGGMGESDPGVYVLSTNDDLLRQHGPLLRDGMARVHAARHGVPFYLCTTGLGNDTDWSVPLEALANSNNNHNTTIQVSLYGSNPAEYARAAGIADGRRAFGQVCAFLVACQELRIPTEVAVVPEYAKSARELALTLGAQQVHVYEPVPSIPEHS
jgi:hypothetical protein